MKNLFAMVICFTLSFLLTDCIKRINETSKETLIINNNIPLKEIIRVDSKGAISMFLDANGVTTFTYRHPNVFDSVPRDGLFLDLSVSGTSKYYVESTGVGSTYINTTKGQTTHTTYKQ